MERRRGPPRCGQQPEHPGAGAAEVVAALSTYSTDEHAFDDSSVELAATFAAYAGVALANMHLDEAQGRVAEQLQQAMPSRAVIEQAKGILMGQRRCSAEQAFDLLVGLSQDSNRKLRDVAQALVDHAQAAGDGRWCETVSPQAARPVDRPAPARRRRRGRATRRAALAPRG